MLIAGRFANRQRLVSWALVAFGAAGILPPLARSPGELFGFLLLIGAATGLLDVAINARASRIETTYETRIMDGVHAAFSAGVVVGGIGGGIARGLGAHPTAILPLISVIVAATATLNLDAVAGGTDPAGHDRLRRALLVVGAILCIAFLVENGLETWSALFLERRLNTSPAISGLGPGLFATAMVTGRLLAQRIHRPAVWARMAFAGTAAAVGLVIAAFAPHPAVALLGFVVAGLGLALSAPTLFGRAGRLGGGAAISTVAVLGYLGFLGGPPLFGAVAGATSLRGGFFFLAGVAVLLALSSPLLRSESNR
jgi:MFS transporter